ncbi:MAG: hypothetical protein ACSLFD_11410 [Solirubrobacterales bacterium]
MNPGYAALAFLASIALLAGCESTQSKSAKLEAEGEDLVKTEKVDIGAANKQIDIVEKTVLTDVNGSAVAVVMKNDSQGGLADAKISVNVKGANGKSVYRNDAAGVETSLIQVPVVAAGGEVIWVNDQVIATAPPKSVEVTVGEAKQLPRDLPEIEVSEPKLTTDPTSGIEAVGTVTNKSDIDQIDIVLYAIARKGGKIVAAGRGQIANLKTDGKPATYHIFFIGNPTGADVTVVAPPVNLE